MKKLSIEFPELLAVQGLDWYFRPKYIEFA